MDNTSAQNLWSLMLTTLEAEVSAITFDVWIKTLEAWELDEGKLVLLAPSEKSRDFVLQRYHTLISSVMKKHNHLLQELEVLDPSSLEKQQPKTKVAVESVSTAKSLNFEPVLLNSKYNFDSFVVGKSNQLVYATARAIAEDPGKRYNPLFIYGGVGLGKTHIMHAIGNAIRKNTDYSKVLYVSSEKFTNEFIEGIRQGSQTSNSFREKYRTVDVLMVDDVQFFAHKDGTQEEFFHTFNDLYSTGRQIVLTSDRPPKEIGGLADRLQSRFECGMIADIQSPDLETRIAILQKKAQTENQNLPLEVISFMAERINNNIREMEGLFNKVVLLSLLENKAPTIDIVKTALKDYEEKTAESVSMEDIIDRTCVYYNMDKGDVLGKQKTKEIVETRQMCMYLITELLSVPLATIGTVFGGRDHTTVMHARNKVADKLKDNQRLKLQVQDIKDLLFKA
ncbi:MAG: chromosomal replication initiator protein DnaA [Clostridiales bacterium]|jgi:chromosomal replication initiator protein|nr:chromosomal replication initiator protein DnaA [Clostridiales bacterium]